MRASGNGDPDVGPARPFNSECFRFAAQPEHRLGRILRPIPASGMDLVRGTRTPVRIKQSYDCANAARIFRRPIQADAQAGFTAGVAIELGRASILPDSEVESSVVVVVTKRHAPTLTIDFQPALISGNRDEVPASVAFQPESASGVVTGRRGRNAEEVLADENVLVAIAIQIADGNAENR